MDPLKTPGGEICLTARSAPFCRAEQWPSSLSCARMAGRNGLPKLPEPTKYSTWTKMQYAFLGPNT